MPASALVSCALGMGITMAEVRRMPRNALVMLIDARNETAGAERPEDDVRDATQADIEALKL